MLSTSHNSRRFLSSIFLAGALGALTLGGCAVSTVEPGPAESVGMASEALSGSSVAAQLFGDWHASNGLYPKLHLGADGTYSRDTGIRCITTPCPSGDSGAWGLYRGGAEYYVALFADSGAGDWYHVGLKGASVTKLAGAFGTQGSFVKTPATPFCVEWEAADASGNSSQAFYAENVASYEEGKARLAAIAPYFIHEAIHEGTCASQAGYCPQVYVPVCGQTFNDPLKTFSNVCMLEVAIRKAALSDQSAKGRWTAGACEATPAPRCGGIAGVACPGLGSCVDDPSDSCDPGAGGADCGGICRCDALAKCAAGFVWDASPTVCTCVASP